MKACLVFSLARLEVNVMLVIESMGAWMDANITLSLEESSAGSRFSAVSKRRVIGVDTPWALVAGAGVGSR